MYLHNKSCFLHTHLVTRTASPPSANGIADIHQNTADSCVINPYGVTTSQQVAGNGHTDVYNSVKAYPPLAEQGQGVDIDEDELIVETRNIQAEFNILFTKVRRFLVNQGVAVDDFVVFLENEPGYGSTSLFDAEISDLREATDLPSVFRIVGNRCSWFNHSFLGDIVKAYCEDDKKIEKAHKDYCIHLQKYCKHRVRMCPLKNWFGSGGKKDKLMILKVDRNWNDIQIEQVEEVVFNLACILKVPRHTLHLRSVENGCVQLTILVPYYIPDSVFPLTTEQETASREMGVIDLQFQVCISCTTYVVLAVFTLTQSITRNFSCCCVLCLEVANLVVSGTG